MAETMDQFFGGERLKFSFNSTVTGMTHDYGSPEDLVDEIVNARVYGGMHFRGSVLQGAALGRAVGHWVFRHSLQPRNKGGY
jgi:hypothetical protein